FRRGLQQVGFVEGQNVEIEYRSAEGYYERLPALAADLVHRPVTVIVAIGATLSAQAAKRATSAIPIVFANGGDALATGLVGGLARPEANVTGISFNQSGLDPKRLELLCEMMPSAKLISYLMNTSNTQTVYQEALKTAARTLGRDFVIFGGSTGQEI